jgi:MoxR-like ATPase
VSPVSQTPSTGADLRDVAAVGSRIAAAIEHVIEGKPEAVRLAVTVLLAEGHLLVEDVPGVGKTMLAKALARAVDCSVRRVQFTPDLLPSDITGVSVYNQDTRGFEFKPGAIFANIVVGDEINRASPKTQSALLECMEERQVTVDGVTYALPEAQRDRFTARIALGYPSPDAELAILDTHSAGTPLDDLEPVTDDLAVAKLISAVRSVYVADSVRRYAVDLVTATRGHPDLRLGASPRATLHLLRTGRAVAALDERDYVLPDDLFALAVPVLAHRLLLSADAQISRRTAASVVEGILAEVPVPAVISRRPA